MLFFLTVHLKTFMLLHLKNFLKTEAEHTHQKGHITAIQLAEA